jgi:hypothetical protein
MRHRLELDLYYTENWSFYLDITCKLPPKEIRPRTSADDDGPRRHHLSADDYWLAQKIALERDEWAVALFRPN